MSRVRKIAIGAFVLLLAGALLVPRGDHDDGALAPSGDQEKYGDLATSRSAGTGTVSPEMAREIDRVVAEGRGFDTPVRDVASRPVIGCGGEDTLQAAMDLMAAHHVRRLPVRDGSGLVTGWITLADLSRRLIVGNDALQTALRDLTEAAAA